MSLALSCIVEGHGDVSAVPILVRQIAQAWDSTSNVHVGPCLRVPRYRLVKDGELERAIELAARKMQSKGAILVLVDSDDDCPAQLGPELLRRAQKQRATSPIAVVLAKFEFENWFLAAAESLRGKRGLPHDLQEPAEPEGIRGAKEWLSAQMPPGRSYREILDQPALTAALDLNSARRARSFDKCYRDITSLLDRVKQLNET